MAKRPTPKTASIRDFSGGWNASDSPYNLATKFQTASDNVVIGVNNAITPRFGYKIEYNFKDGTATALTPPVGYTVTTTVGAFVVTFTWTNHPFQSGDHITLSATTTVGGIVLNGVYGVIKTGANTFDIIARSPATANSSTASLALGITRDTHLLAGDIVEITSFQGNMVVIDALGEIVSRNLITKLNTKIWDVYRARLLPGSPVGWRRQLGANNTETALTLISFDTFKQSLLMSNGYQNDKPIDISFTRTAGPVVQFLQDPATSSNSFVYPCDHIQSFDSYVLLYRSNNTTTTGSNTSTTVDISAVGTSGVFVGNSNPDDAVQIDVGRASRTTDPTITGVATLRDRVVVTFYDTAMLGKLGIYSQGATPVHDPDFSDQIPQHGALNRRVIANLGNDLLMCDYVGVPAYSQSVSSGVLVPDRVSQLIEPVLNTHLGRMKSETLKNKVFAVYNIRDRQYMLTIPKFDDNYLIPCAADAIILPEDLVALNQALIVAANHQLSVGDKVKVLNTSGVNNAAFALATLVVIAAPTPDTIVVQCPTNPGIAGTSGQASHVQPINDENIVYVFSYSPQLRIRRWTRFRGLMFSAGTVSRDGKVYFTKDGSVYEFGTTNNPIYGDAVNEWDVAWTNNTLYSPGTRVYDSVDGSIWTVSEPYTSNNTSGFAAERAGTAPWVRYTGKDIVWSVDTPWSSLGDRNAVKQGINLTVDAQGSAPFSVSVFTDSVEYAEDNTSSPQTSMRFVGVDAPGYGVGTQQFGGGRRIREERNFAFPFRCRLAKFRLSGSTTAKVVISGLHVLYQRGSIMR